MSKFTLPSGREVELRDPLYGDVIDAEDAYREGGRLNAFWESLACALSGLGRDELRALSAADGRALTNEVIRLKGEAEQLAAPLSNSSST